MTYRAIVRWVRMQWWLTPVFGAWLGTYGLKVGAIGLAAMVFGALLGVGSAKFDREGNEDP